MSRQTAGGLARSEKLSPERRAEIARAAAQARWNGERQPSKRVTFTLRETDVTAIEALRVAMGLNSAGAVIRKLVRQAAKKELSK